MYVFTAAYENRDLYNLVNFIAKKKKNVISNVVQLKYFISSRTTINT